MVLYIWIALYHFAGPSSKHYSVRQVHVHSGISVKDAETQAQVLPCAHSHVLST